MLQGQRPANLARPTTDDRRPALDNVFRSRATALGALAYIVLLVPNGNLSEEFARESTIEIPMDELDTSSESRRGLRFVLFAVLLCAYLISGILPVTTYTNGNGNSEYLYGHHAFFYSLTGKKSDRERPQQWGLLPNFAFLAGMTMLFHGQYLGAAGAGAVATCLAIAVFGIGPDDFRPCSAADVYWCHDWKNLPHAHGPFLIGFYVWSLTFASLCAVGVVGMIKPRSSDGLDEPASTPRI